MDVVSRLVAIALCAFVPLAHAGTTRLEVDLALDRWQLFIEEAAQRFAIPAIWIRDVMRAESAGQAFIDAQPSTSTAGAMGLMQVMPATYAELRDRYGFGTDPYDPHDNILAGAAYLHELYERYGWPSLFAAYHAGPTRFEEYLSAGRPLPEATRHYLATLVPERSQRTPSHVQPVITVSIFVPLARSRSAAATSSSLSSDDRLFIHLREVDVVTDAYKINRENVSGATSNADDP